MKSSGPSPPLGAIPAYPEGAAERTQWILDRRPNLSGHRLSLATDRAAWIAEDEPAAEGGTERSLTVFLVNRECRWRCLMCDLWKHTLTGPTPVGAIAHQLAGALAGAPGHFDRLKLYNAGSFFDAGAVPPAEYAAVAQRAARFSSLTVECHPRLVGASVFSFQERLGNVQLEVAMGLETAHPEVLARLNKGMTLDDFRSAAGALRARGIAVRAFVLVNPPFMEEAAALEWGVRSVEAAFDMGAGLVALIPVRRGNGAMEALEAAGFYRPPRLETLAEALRRSLGLGRGRVIADVWDLGLFEGAPGEAQRWRNVIEGMNLTQRPAAA